MCSTMFPNLISRREEAGETVANNNVAAVSDDESKPTSSGFVGLPVEGGDEEEDFGGLMVRGLKCMDGWT